MSVLDFELQKGIFMVCIIIGAIVGVGLGAAVGHIELLASIGAAVGFFFSFGACSRYSKAVRAAKANSKR